MIKYQEILNQVTKETPLVQVPDQQYSYFAYKDGKFYTCENVSDALKISKNYVCIENIESKKLRDAAIKHNRDVEAKVFDILYYNDLREEYSDLTDAQFNLIYSKAYENGHSSGHDEAANEFINVLEFALAILKAK